jgi:predicted dienelactone hydrolase
MLRRALGVVCVVAGLAFASPAARAAGAGGAARPAYDPLVVPAAPGPAPIDLEVADEGRAREIPVRIYLPAGSGPAPVVLFSHGLGGSRTGYRYLADHWQARGYVVVALQHPGSDDAVWRDAAPARRMAAMREAANLRSFLDRVGDVQAVLDQLERWNVAGPPALAGRLDLRQVGMAGHSFGAITTQAVSGETFSARGPVLTDKRIAAAIAMSPSSPRREDPATAFASVRIPWMLMTGTQDMAPIGNADVASRLAVFPALPPGGKYEVVLDGAQHSAFSDRALPGDRPGRNPNHHRVVLALSTAFWDAYLRGDAAARAWLDGAGPSSVLQAKDRWQKK